MANTYTLISSVAVGSGGAATVTFSSIPTDYTDLVILYSTRAESTGTTWINLTFNTGGTYTKQYIFGTGSVVNAGSGVFATNNNASYTANVFANGEIYIPNYLSSNAKSIIGTSVNENNATQVETAMGSQLWSGTAAISTITFATDTGTDLAEYSNVYLYGISNA
jgi:hypothetical protein